MPDQAHHGQDQARNGITLKLVREGVYTWNIYSHADNDSVEAFDRAVSKALEITHRLEAELPHATPHA